MVLWSRKSVCPSRDENRKTKWEWLRLKLNQNDSINVSKSRLFYYLLKWVESAEPRKTYIVFPIQCAPIFIFILYTATTIPIHHIILSFLLQTQLSNTIREAAFVTACVILKICLCTLWKQSELFVFFKKISCMWLNRCDARLVLSFENLCIFYKKHEPFKKPRASYSNG